MTKKLIGPTPTAVEGAVTRAHVDGHDGGVPLRPKSSGEQIGPAFFSTTTGGSAFASGGAFGCFIPVAREVTIDAMGARVTTAQAGVNAKIVLYSCDTEGHPVTLVATGIIGCDSLGYAFGTTGTVVLSPGQYWASLRTDTGTTVRFQAMQDLSVNYVGTYSGGSTQRYAPTANVGTYASLTSPITTWNYTALGANSIPHIVLRMI